MAATMLRRSPSLAPTAPAATRRRLQGRRSRPCSSHTRSTPAGSAPRSVQASVSVSAPVAASSSRAPYRVTGEQLEVIDSLNDWAEHNLLPLLKPVEVSWQPTDYLPDPSSTDFLDEVAELRKRTGDVPDELLVTIVGDMVTEEALPTYQTMLNTLDGIRDETGADPTPWAKWTRAWTAEENRHGDLMNKYLMLTGRVDMRAVEKTIQYLIGAGMDPKTDKNPYLGYIYTSFQERATKISHGNTARMAKESGDDQLGKVCGIIAADEARHEMAYQKVVDKLFEVDGDGAMRAYEAMMRTGVSMPAHLMYDGQSDTLWSDFSAVAERLGVYTARDYADIIEHCNDRWKVADRRVNGDAQKGQDFVMKLPSRIRRLADRQDKRKVLGEDDSKPKTASVSWIFNREVAI